MKKLLVLAALCAASSLCHATGFTILSAVDSPRGTYASRKLREAVESAGVLPAAGDHAVFELRIDSALGAEAFSIQPPGRPHPHRRWRCARHDLRRTRSARTIAQRHRRSTRISATTQKPALAFRGIKFNTPGTPIGRVRHWTSTTPRARRQVLGGVPRHDGREPLQRRVALDHASVHLHDPAEELPGSQPGRTPSSPSGSSSIATFSAWPRNAASTPTSCSGASS